MPPAVDAVERAGPGPVAVGSRFPVRRPGLAAAEYAVVDWRPEAGFTRVATVAGVRTPASRGLVPGGAGTLPAHAHRAHGSTEMRAVLFASEGEGPFIARPPVLAFTPLLREAVTALTDGALEEPTRGRLEQVVLELLRTVRAPQRFLPSLADPRLRTGFEFQRAADRQVLVVATAR